MCTRGTGYDISASEYAPDGRVFQVEYAQKAVDHSGMVIGVRCLDGIVFGIEKLITSSMYESYCNRRIYTIDSHIGMACAGFLPDARVIVTIARAEAAYFRAENSLPISCKILADRVSMYFHSCTRDSSIRPFGCSIMIGGCDESGPSLFVIDPSGTCLGYFGSALGKGKHDARAELEKLGLPNITCREAVKEVARIIHLVNDPVKDKHFVMELSWVCGESNQKHSFIPQSLFYEVEQYGRTAVMDSSDDECMC